MNAVANEVLADPAVKNRLAGMGATSPGGTPQQLARHLAAETEKWGRVVREAKIAARQLATFSPRVTAAPAGST